MLRPSSFIKIKVRVIMRTFLRTKNPVKLSRRRQAHMTGLKVLVAFV